MTVEYEIVEDGVLLVTLNRPERLNALNGAAKLALAQVWQRAQDDCAVRAIVLRGAGERAFCAGSDLKEIAATGETVSTQVLANSLPGVGTPLTKPVIAALQGHTLGLGISLAIHCDFRIARHDTRFSFPEVGHGMLSGFSTVTLPSLIGEAAALDIMLSARPFDAAQALELGLVNAVVDDSIAAALDLARRLATHDSRAMQWTKRLLLADRNNRLQQHLALIDEARTDVMQPH
ncbi:MULTISPECIES: enoyl-CoA hydratase/isomerase family protein [unclassified Pseudomonas]|uniref:enoyl-CoA hydratase/isomerase family protein n=1 Tax=unclassified Pseudomonas TaxID=196821 RepID=UPI0012979D4B|nr:MULTISPECIES: enoyl-CoA hydratase/isomerase family protein [unclassified Pseudomonas]MQT43607.1 enoyl-CoA hydratase/isomerase family protein [Pseudomonas sp. FSL R10-0765]MQT52850.1 enoyl-CoA hydratase/isomerase family protein [Pseudomonas sp. FSL R10-2398]MQU01124.1 enoyl-CoA hydratase/isomerase family protein [Pseudomonas sp. FSL R10-2245]MQU11066.1 enoyl-CoA hydratase/isomerase family protein [Pseudomonas sp. FSL R10-2189]MQU37890.1 enoyl-CoA hydratase/isomerase family protein [Pseudomon